MRIERWMPRGPHLLKLAIALLLMRAAWNFAQIGVQIRAAQREAARATLATHASPAASAASVWQHLLDSHLFGTPASGGDAPPTTLPLKLEGVWADASGRGYAMIAADHAPSHVYAVGAALPYGGTLRRVLGSGVLIDTPAGLRSLALPEPAAASSGSSAATLGMVPAAAATPTAAPDSRRWLAEALAPRPKPMVWPPGDGPLQMGTSVVGAPVLRDGRVAAYQLQPGRDAAAFARLGLKPGDLLTGIDGQPVGGPRQAADRLRQVIATGGQVEIERDGHAMSLSPHDAPPP